MLKGISIYTIAGFLGAGLNFLVLPILSRYLSPDEYGLLSIYNTYASLLIPFIGIMAAGLINVEYYKIKDKKEFASFFSSLQLLPILPCVLFSMIVLLSPDAIVNWLFLPAGVSKIWISLLVLAALLTIYTETFLSIFIICKKPAAFAIANVLKMIIEIGLTLLFVVHYNMGWKGRVYAWFITLAIYTAVGFVYFYNNGFLTKIVNIKYITQGIKFGAPLIMYSLSILVINQSDRIFIAYYISLDDAGIYNMGYQFGTVLLIAANAFHYFSMPFLFERLGSLDRSRKIQIVRIGYFALAAMAVLLIALTGASPFIFTNLIAPKYNGATVFIFWTGLSYIFWAVFVYFSNFILYQKKSKVLAYLSCLNIAINIILNFVFMPIFGAIGASYATVLSFFINMVLIIYLVSRDYSLPWLSFGLIFNRKYR